MSQGSKKVRKGNDPRKSCPTIHPFPSISLLLRKVPSLVVNWMRFMQGLTINENNCLRYNYTKWPASIYFQFVDFIFVLMLI